MLSVHFSSMYKLRINQVDDEEADTLTYDLKNLYKYRPDLSVADAENQTICSISALMSVRSISILFHAQT